jgi:hypothetical protein
MLSRGSARLHQRARSGSVLGHPHRAEVASADSLEQFVRTDPVAGFLGLKPCGEKGARLQQLGRVPSGNWRRG